MRTAFVSLILVCLAGCSGTKDEPKIDRIEMRMSGRFAIDVSVNSRGEGSYHVSQPFPNGRDGSFSIRPQQFNRLVEQLQPYRYQAVPFTDESARRFATATCPKGVPFTYDVGALWVRWIGPSVDQHYLADFGCDPERNTVRNEQLIGIWKGLPLPIE